MAILESKKRISRKKHITRIQRIKIMKTQAIVFEGPRSVSLRDVELPAPGTNDVVLKTLLSAVSVGTERWALEGKRAEMEFPHVPGYMAVGEVTSVGDAAAKAGYATGQRIYFGKSRLASPYQENSWMGTHLAQAVVDVVSPRPDPDFFCHERVPEGTAPEDISLAALSAVAMRGIELAGIPAGAKILVVGLGVIGQYAAQICRLKGALVAATDVVGARLKTAADLGAEWVIDGKNESLADRAAQIASEGFDIIIDTSSRGDIVNTLWPLLKRYGKFIFQGWYPPLTGLALDAAHGKMPTVFFPCGYSEKATAACMRWMRDGRLNTRALVTHTATPQDYQKIFDMVLAGSENFLGITFDWTKA